MEKGELTESQRQAVIILLEKKDKCKELGIGGVSKYKKPEFVSILLGEFVKLGHLLKDKKKISLFSLCHSQASPRVTTKEINPFGPAIWPAIGNIFTNVLLYIDYH